MKDTAYQTQRQRDYDEAHTTRVNLKLNNRTDADILEWLHKQPSMQGAIKELVRNAIREETAPKEPTRKGKTFRQQVAEELTEMRNADLLNQWKENRKYIVEYPLTEEQDRIVKEYASLHGVTPPGTFEGIMLLGASHDIDEHLKLLRIIVEQENGNAGQGGSDGLGTK